MRFAYVYDLDASDINVQSGRPFSILSQIERRTGPVERVFPLEDRVKYVFAPRYAFNRLRGLRYRPDRETLLLRSLARQVSKRLKGSDADCVFCPGSHAVAELETKLPKIFCADATFQNVIGFYDSFSNLAPSYLAQGHRLERKALASCAAAIYPSDWAAQSAVRDYGADPRKVHVVPFGANVQAPDRATVADRIAARPTDRLVVLFSGREWERKGADIVLAACEMLQAGGIPVELHLVGIRQPPVALPPFATSHGLLNKRDPAQNRLMQDLLANAHVMFVPSRAENYGMTFCEAAAYGLPSLSTAVGGIPTIVRDGVNGWCLPLEAGPADYATVLAGMWADYPAYLDLAHASLAEYHARLNWDAFGDRLMEIAKSVA
ncbi:glycosyltransferase family 4 protein [Aerophototrophica crusticola]|uniref:Glycosyltransferase family 4 protein n=1 Tax=Aerophototrophica crusticola TaxID=1709002 RepID=A0A858R485_9PROT|nr:glycosyltransferase family 4 protein [Rhodospirillaceae bacterium B3]